MAATFENLWRVSRNLFPGIPPLVVREWAQDAYAEACAYSGWSFLRAEAFLTTLAARSVAATVTQGSTTVTSAGLFLSTDVGRQFRVGTYPVYTIRTFTDANTIVLDRAYQAADTAVTGQILNTYAVMPSDFGRFIVIYNPYEQRTIQWAMSQDQLALADPARSISDSGPRFLVSHTLSGEASTLGQVRHEYHPYPTAARQYPYLYVKEAERLADAALLLGPFFSRTDVLKKGIELKAARWPGTKDQPNPYFNLGHYDRLSQEWKADLHALWLGDDDVYPDQLTQVDWAALGSGGLGHTTHWLRQTDASLSSYV